MWSYIFRKHYYLRTNVSFGSYFRSILYSIQNLLHYITDRNIWSLKAIKGAKTQYLTGQQAQETFSLKEKRTKRIEFEEDIERETEIVFQFQFIP